MRGFPSHGEHRVTGMRARKGFSALVGIAVLAIALLAVPRYGQTQQADLSQQMQLFNNMTPDQQQSILQRLGGQGSGNGLTGLNGSLGGGLGGSSGGGVNSSQALLLQQMQLQQQRRLAILLQGQSEIQVFKPGDTVLVHGGTYRERVDPSRGGLSADRRITYLAAPGENPCQKHMRSQQFARLSKRIPCATEQGINSSKTGNAIRKTGN